MWLISRALLFISCAGLLATSGCAPADNSQKPLVGVVFLVHGGFEEFSAAALWDSTLQIFAYDPNSFVYQRVIWNPAAWDMILNVGNAPKELGKYSFELERIGGRDPAMQLSRQQLADMTVELEEAADSLNVRIMTDYVNWIGDIPHLAHPRNIYAPGIADGASMNYCSSDWPTCDPARYDTTGSIDRMLEAGVDKIVVIDLTTSGVRFFKSNDVIRQSRRVIADHNQRTGEQVRLHWLNDPGELMRDSYPDAPANWTSSLGAPQHDPKIPLLARTNPVAADIRFASLHAEGIRAQLNPDVPAAETGLLLINHATRAHNQLFDPKIDDTLVLNANIRNELLQQMPGLNPAHIVGAWMGVKERNSKVVPRPPSTSQLERTRSMRGENLGHAYLYETDQALPTGQWGYRYWDALEYLKNSGVKHIVIAFPQIMVDSVLNLVELPNQIAKEIGYRNWLHIDALDFETYPSAGHPFADYWGIWVEQQCPVSPGSKDTTDCCFEMGGCSDGRPYPPPRLSPPDRARNDMDPSLAYDVSEYGHLGYEPERGLPETEQPVQDQYRGSWAIWSPPNADPRVGHLLAEHVIRFLQSEMPAER